MRWCYTLSDDTKEAWEALFVPSSLSHRDPDRAPTEVAPSTPVLPEEEKRRHPLSPKLLGSTLKTEAHLRMSQPLNGVATNIDAKDGALLRHFPSCRDSSKVTWSKQGLKRAPNTKWINGVRDPNCDHCKRALGPLHQTGSMATIICRYSHLISQNHILTV